ncbi:hypothetical protein SAMN06297144_2001 [Sphingomonas guangdongensis]|uniref:Uncharacterized protein n=1 Tax=Sphingomonas guangdongensis TaxID=1141890 RepID=A0A285QY53_9SPHN|nr:hypothetical protein [Sphingomonas guangdongensis]SOB86890.1 hypothetical protein SAMN06297144_2001 [Sphingomonas guangdongensis]
MIRTPPAALRRHRNRWVAFVGVALLAELTGCSEVRDPPPTLLAQGLPISGTRADARRAGFTECVNMDAVSLRCRRRAIRVGPLGPFEAAVDMVGSDGEGGFDQLTIWHERDNNAVYGIARLFAAAGWKHCYTGDGARGDQMILSHPAARVRVSMDVSYYAKRRIRLVPDWNRRERRCTPSDRAFRLNG